MANRYWRGGSGTWNSSNTGNWSTTSGGSGGASVPTASDNAIFDSNSGSPTVTISGTVNCFTWTVSAYAFFNDSGATVNVYGGITWSSGSGQTMSATINWKATGSAGFTASAANTWGTLVVDGVGGECALLSTFKANTISLVNGTFTTNNYSVNAVSFSSNTNSGSSNIRTINMGSSTITLSGSGTVWNVNDSFGTYTQNRGTSTLSLTSASAKTVYAPGYNFYNVVQAGAGALTYTAGGTINNMTVTALPTTIKLQSYGPFTFTTFGLSGTSGNQLTLTSTSSGSPVGIQLASGSGTVSVSYTTLQDIDASTYGSGTTWLAYTSNGNVDNGGNTGWVFQAPNTGNFMGFF